MQRRTFLKNAAAISAVTMVSPSVAFGSRANSAIRVGIIGCGGRGTAVLSSMSEHTNTNIVAMADLFEDQLQKKKETFDQLNANNGFPKIPAKNMYQGSDAYKKLLNNQDVCARFIGTKGIAEAHYGRGVYITGENEWDSGILRSSSPSQEDISAGTFSSSLHDANENKVKSFIHSIESGNHLNQAKEGARSTLSAIMGREAGISEGKVTWDEMYLSNSKLDPQLNLNQLD